MVYKYAIDEDQGGGGGCDVISQMQPDHYCRFMALGIS